MTSATEMNDDLENLRLPDLQRRFVEVVGEDTRCPNKQFLIRRIREALRQQQEAAEAAPAGTANEATQESAAVEAPAPAEPRIRPLRQAIQSARSPRGRFKSMTVEELQTMYLDRVGRPTGSSDKNYLIWKIREAEKGRIPIGPRESRSADQQGQTDVRILPLRLDADAVEKMDAAWKAQGLKSRMEFFRRALGHYLEHLGADEAAAAFTVAES